MDIKDLIEAAYHAKWRQEAKTDAWNIVRKEEREARINKMVDEFNENRLANETLSEYKQRMKTKGETL